VKRAESNSSRTWHPYGTVILVTWSSVSSIRSHIQRSCAETPLLQCIFPSATMAGPCRKRHMILPLGRGAQTESALPRSSFQGWKSFRFAFPRPKRAVVGGLPRTQENRRFHFWTSVASYLKNGLGFFDIAQRNKKMAIEPCAPIESQKD
jgi:hypothetical protein